jgi:hypothetical protein
VRPWNEHQQQRQQQQTTVISWWLAGMAKMVQHADIAGDSGMFAWAGMPSKHQAQNMPSEDVLVAN